MYNYFNDFSMYITNYFSFVYKHNLLNHLKVFKEINKNSLNIY